MSVRKSQWAAAAVAVFVTATLLGLYKSRTAWPGETATIRGSFWECASPSCTRYVPTPRHLSVRFYQSGLLGRTIVVPVDRGNFEVRLPLGAYHMSVDGCEMPKGEPIAFTQTYPGGRYLQWAIDAHGVCVLGPEPPSGIFCCSGPVGLLPGLPRRIG